MSHLKYCPQVAQTEISSHSKVIMDIKIAEITAIASPKFLQSLSMSHTGDGITASVLTKSLAKIILLEHHPPPPSVSTAQNTQHLAHLCRHTIRVQ